jgi:hypothetical protein
MSVSTFVDRMRRRQVDVMLSEATVTRPSGDLTYADGVETPADGDELYSGACNPMPTGTTTTVERRTEHGAEQITVHLYRVKFPWDADPFAVDDLIAMTASKDPTFAGVTLQITDVERSDYQVSRVYLAIEYLR